MKDLKTTELLDKVNEKDLSDELFDKATSEIDNRIPFLDLDERIDRLAGLVDEQQKEIKKLRACMRNHVHLLPNGKSAIEI